MLTSAPTDVPDSCILVATSEVLHEPSNIDRLGEPEAQAARVPTDQDLAVSRQPFRIPGDWWRGTTTVVVCPDLSRKVA